MLSVIHTLGEIYRLTSIFLAGPTARQEEGEPPVPSWRKEAVEELLDAGFDGIIYYPEWPNGIKPDDWTYSRQVSWEVDAMTAATVILFWIPRTESLPGFTTNVEFGEWFRSEKIVIGSPEGAIKNEYLKERCYMKGIPWNYSLKKTVKHALATVSLIKANLLAARPGTNRCPQCNSDQIYFDPMAGNYFCDNCQTIGGAALHAPDCTGLRREEVTEFIDFLMIRLNGIGKYNRIQSTEAAQTREAMLSQVVNRLGELYGKVAESDDVKVANPPEKGEVPEELYNYLQEHLRGTYLDTFGGYQSKYGTVSPVLMLDRDGNPTEDQSKCVMPWAVHFREGMHVRNLIRSSGFCPDWDPHTMDDLWIPIVTEILRREGQS